MSQLAAWQRARYDQGTPYKSVQPSPISLVSARAAAYRCGDDGLLGVVVHENGPALHISAFFFRPDPLLPELGTDEKIDLIAKLLLDKSASSIITK